ncbi:MAG: 50S ribosomal protein L25 [Actinomycetota bacterium]
MPTNVLVATTGRETGSATSRRLRAQDNIPAVVYGHGMSPVSVTVVRRDLRIAVSGANGFNTVLSLKVGNDTLVALIKEVQRHPVKRTVSHLDFLVVNPDEQITVHVPLHLYGEAKAVLQAGGLVDPAVDHIDLVTTPNQMPSEVRLDITDLQPGQVIHLGELTLPAGCTAIGDPDMPVVIAMLGSLGAPARS